MVIEGRYGVRVTRTSWDANDGGKPTVGTRREMLALVLARKRETDRKLQSDEVVLYEIVPYVEPREG